MKKTKVVWLGAIVFLFLIQTNVFAAGKPIKKGEPFPEFKLAVPKDTKQQEYLGINNEGTFNISDIKTTVIIIQLFHSG